MPRGIIWIFEEIKEVNEAIVFIYLPGETKPVPAGRVKNIESGRYGKSEFQYGAKYLEREDKLPIDPVTIPLPLNGSQNNYETRVGIEIFGSIRDACPDQWGQFLMAKAAKKAELSDWEYIMASGEDRVGALAFGVSPDKVEPIRPWDIDEGSLKLLDLRVSYELFKKIEDNDSENVSSIQSFVARGGSLGGARPKATIEYKKELWLAKFSKNDDQRNMVRAEYATMKLAEKCGIDIPPIKCVSVGDEEAYLIKRFDRKILGKEYQKEHFISALTLLDEHEMSAYHRSYQEISEALQKYSIDPKVDCLKLFKRMVFNVLVNNTDDHLRNHGLLCKKGKWVLSPVYDVMVWPKPTESSSQAVAIGKQGRESTIVNLLSDVESFGITSSEAHSVYEEIRSEVKNWDSVFEECGVPSKDIELYRDQKCFKI